MTLVALVLLLAGATSAVAGESEGPTVRRCRGPDPTASSAEVLRKLAVEFVQSSNFNTVSHPEILRESVATIHQRFGITEAFVSTMQAVSGAGYPGVASLDIVPVRSGCATSVAVIV